MTSSYFNKYIVKWLGILLANLPLINSAATGGRGNPDTLTSASCQREASSRNQEKAGN